MKVFIEINSLLVIQCLLCKGLLKKIFFIQAKIRFCYVYGRAYTNYS